VAAVRLPRLANFTDLDPLAVEPGVRVRLVDDTDALGQPDLVVVPGTKATVADLDWFRARRFDEAVAALGDALVLGVCGGYQMLGRSILDDVESGRGAVAGLGWLDVETVFEDDKVTRQRRGTAMGQRVSGYQIHHGRVRPGAEAPPWVHLDDAYGQEEEGAVAPDGAPVLGTTLHGLFEEDGLRGVFLTEVARRRGKTFVPAGVSFRASREAQLDRLADALEAHVDVAAVEGLIELGAGVA
jgi:adenosylcobyric acid synthase